MALIEVKNLTKTYQNGEIVTRVLKGIDFSVNRGEFLAIMGRSGAGKSTFLYQIGLLDHPSSGSIVIDGVETEKLSSDERTDFRLRRLGYIFQDYALLPELTAVENVAIPLLMQGIDHKHALAESKKALERVNLGHRAESLPSQLSGGEQQRASIARAIAHHPEIIFADEPTASLDTESANTVMNIFLELHKAGETIVMVTHEPEYGALAEKIVTLEDGLIVS